jgi:hypothetical protein
MMIRWLKLLILPFLVLFLFSGGAWALNLGTDITIFDQRERNDYTWYSGANDTRTNINEDNEVEPDMQRNQVWDLEGFFLDGSILSMVGGWDFIDGVDGYSFTSGDIFIDVDGMVNFGVVDNSTAPGMGYEYVIDIDWKNRTYNAFSLKGVDDSQFEKSVYNSPESDPWQFNPDGSDSKLYAEDRSFTADQLITDPYYNKLFLGTTHYYASGFDLSFIYANNSSWDGVFTSHFTMECGNDNMMGHAPVPEPATMLLLGTGLLGIAGVGRKKLIKK